MTEKQKRFCDEYLVDCNATQAAIRAGYSEKTAHSIGAENLIKPELKTYIDEQLEKLHSEKTADAQEVMEYLTSVMRGESQSEVIVVLGVGDGFSEARRVQKSPDEKERLKAAELIGKRYGIFTDKTQLEGVSQIQIIDDIPDEGADDE
ncbi:MAG: terminase small subunit [Clostridiales bacterium]|nr:terminase small subunit [Clostridiales bacterium]